MQLIKAIWTDTRFLIFNFGMQKYIWSLVKKILYVNVNYTFSFYRKKLNNMCEFTNTNEAYCHNEEGVR